MTKKYTYSRIFDDLTLAYGLVKRMNGFAFCSTGDAELVRLGFMIKTNPKIKPYITNKGKKMLMDVYGKLASDIPEDKSERKELPKPKKPLPGIGPETDYWSGDDEDDEDDEEEEKPKKNKENK